MFIQKGKITPTTKFSSMETTSSKLPTVSTTSRIRKLGQHLHIAQASNTHSNPATEEITFIQWHVISRKMHQENPLTFPGRCIQLAHWNSHYQRCKEHQEKSRPAYLNTDTTTGNVSTCHLNSKHHQICHGSQKTTYQSSYASS